MRVLSFIIELAVRPQRVNTNSRLTTEGSHLYHAPAHSQFHDLFTALINCKVGRLFYYRILDHHVWASCMSFNHNSYHAFNALHASSDVPVLSSCFFDLMPSSQTSNSTPSVPLSSRDQAEKATLRWRLQPTISIPGPSK
jgi:hypothetical protein